VAQGLEMVQALRPGHERGIRDGVGCARQQVGEPERLPQRTAEDGEREVEAAADLPEQVAEELVSRSQKALGV